MCTVTRPGLASIASSTAVELLVSMIQHPKGYVQVLLNYIRPFTHNVSIHAPPPPSNTDFGDTHESTLGLVPHQIRGYLAQFRNLSIIGAAYSKCTGCSETVNRQTFSRDKRLMKIIPGAQCIREAGL
jgi:ubiquitin-like modifier-activating enzyme ATG7